MSVQVFLLLSFLTIPRFVAAAASPTAECSAASFSLVLPPPGTAIFALKAAVVNNYSENIDNESKNWPAGSIIGLIFCQVNITVTHPSIGDAVNNQVWLPRAEWNERFLGVGGGGIWSSQDPAVQRGYAAVSTDAGYTHTEIGKASSWTLVSPGNVNQYLQLDFESRSVHDMTILGKVITEAFCATKPSFSYRQGCSMGGRHSLEEAQIYPHDYDAICIAAPAN